MPKTSISLSICICTSGRPEALRRCLESIYSGQLLPDEIIVSDDSHISTKIQAICREFPFARYLHGPQRGLCANRNAVVAASFGDYISLMDDDAVVGPDFFRLASELASRMSLKTILTGDVLEDGNYLIPPSNPSFWGHFGSPVRGRYENINLNCNIFPRTAFEVARFDEAIAYGYEDMDLCAHLLAAGYQISYHPELVNSHLPPPKDATTLGLQRRQSERARYYTSLKRYLIWQRNPLKALAYSALAPLHRAAHHLRHREITQFYVAFAEMGWAVRATMQPLIQLQKQRVLSHDNRD